MIFSSGSREEKKSSSFPKTTSLFFVVVVFFAVYQRYGNNDFYQSQIMLNVPNITVTARYNLTFLGGKWRSQTAASTEFEEKGRHHQRKSNKLLSPGRNNREIKFLIRRQGCQIRLLVSSPTQ